MTVIMKGTPVAELIYTNIKTTDKVLHIFQVGNLEESNRYIRNKIRKAESLGINTELHKVEKESDFESIPNAINSLSQDLDKVAGIFVQLPFGFCRDREEEIVQSIPPEVDVDGLTVINIGKLFSGKGDGYAPATAQGVIDMLEFYNIPIEGKTVGVIGRSDLVGKPLIPLLLDKNATVLSMNSRTLNIKDKTRICDILIVAVGVPGFVDETFIDPDSRGVAIVDVGTTVVDGTLVGDVDYHSVTTNRNVAAISPVPGGVGPLTIANLMRNTTTEV